MNNTTKTRHASARRAASALLSLLLALANTTAVAPQTRRGDATPSRASSASSWQRPRLVLFIAVDQFRYEYVERFGDLFAANGLRRMMREGASWANANYDHVPTETAPGHATMLTGAWPSETGVIGNEWYERNAKGDGGRRVFNTADDEARILGGGDEESGASPRRLLASTVGDELRLASAGRSKVIGVSVKDRGAMMPVGRNASAAYWLSAQNGAMVSSSYYFKELPAWVARFNAQRPSDKYFGARWDRLAPEAEYARRAGADDAAWERGTQGKTRNTFPHTVTGGAERPNRNFYAELPYTPFANDILVDFAKEAITNEGLGADADTDVLSVSFSANDYVGHRYGPYSHETMDAVLRVDRQIGALLDFVDSRVGLRNTVVALTADHGVAPIPEHSASLRLPGARVKQEEIREKIKEGLRDRLAPNDSAGRADDYLLEYTAKNGNVYLNLEALRRDRVSRADAERAACEGALRVEGMARCFTRTQLERGAISPNDPVARRVLHGFHVLRSGDAVVVPQPFALVVTYTADHYSPYSYDTHVPLMIMGGGVAPGRYEQAATPADLAPTLAVLLRSETPSNATGRVLIEAIR
ncbi:MAG TPA: alkaline phosphatase family protein [Pyrinomonadaceae bacterium]|nr:alkaline phosphatase family protein [Pyrinomonadaceae bacterium]